MTIGEKIQKLRKQNGLSQEALAEKVSVTRQTISKWELGQSQPDLGFVAVLSDIFNVSSDYLIRDNVEAVDTFARCKEKEDIEKTDHKELLDEEISGKKKAPEEKDVESKPEDHSRRKIRFSHKLRRLTLILFSVAALIGAGVCMICDYFISGGLSWALIAVTSIAAGWLLALPVLIAETGRVEKTLVMVTVVPIPLLAVIAYTLDLWVVFSLGSTLALIALVVMWIIYGIFRKGRNRLWLVEGISLLIVIPTEIMISHISAAFLPEVEFDFTSDKFNAGITLILSLMCFGMDYLSRSKKAGQNDDLK